MLIVQLNHELGIRQRFDNSAFTSILSSAIQLRVDLLGVIVTPLPENPTAA
ncbi:MAG: hypothetical protein IPK52_10750 [Chloroflexi bacterium]|nr:hypothetical protein [Chloroflexota bacterium]